MNREIKFDIISKRSDGKLEHNYMTLEEIEQADADEFDYEVVARREYTGLKDKNGVEIYEGDIFADCDGDNRVVRWNSMTNYHPNLDGEGYDASSAIEVIGNKYDNPELVERAA